jgi:hypothetical protein
MRLWGKIAKVILLIMTGAFAVAAIFVPDKRWQASLATIVALVVARYGVPALVQWFSSFTGDEDILSNGLPGSATKSFFSLAKKSFPFWFGGIWLFCGLPFLLMGLYMTIDTFRLQQRFKDEAPVAEGMVLTKTITSNKDSKNYRVGYRFRAPDGSLVKSEAKVTGDVWDRVTERGPVRVTYLSSDPKINHIEGTATPALLPLKR